MGDEGHRGRRWKLRGHGRWQGDRVEAACTQQRCPQSLPARTSAKCPPPRQAPGPHNGVCAAATPARERIWDLCPALDRGTGLGVMEGTQEMEVMLGSLTLEWGGGHTGPWTPGGSRVLRDSSWGAAKVARVGVPSQQPPEHKHAPQHSTQPPQHSRHHPSGLQSWHSLITSSVPGAGCLLPEGTQIRPDTAPGAPDLGDIPGLGEVESHQPSKAS